MKNHDDDDQFEFDDEESWIGPEEWAESDLIGDHWNATLEVAFQRDMRACQEEQRRIKSTLWNAELSFDDIEQPPIKPSIDRLKRAIESCAYNDVKTAIFALWQPMEQITPDATKIVATVLTLPGFVLVGRLGRDAVECYLTQLARYLFRDPDIAGFIRAVRAAERPGTK